MIFLSSLRVPELFLIGGEGNLADLRDATQRELVQ
jgi:hypothetical protein